MLNMTIASGLLRARLVFDAEKFSRRVKRASPKVLKRQAAYVWGIAKREIRYRKSPTIHAPAGKAPYTHDKTLRRGILFAVHSSMTDALIGPGANWVGTMGALHEFGGVRRQKIPPLMFRKRYKVGDIGPVSTRKYKRAYVSKHKKPYTDPLGGAVAFVRLQSATQVAHANRLTARLARSYATFRMAKYPARPFMRPSLDKARHKLPSFWRKAITK